MSDELRVIQVTLSLDEVRLVTDTLSWAAMVANNDNIGQIAFAVQSMKAMEILGEEGFNTLVERIAKLAGVAFPECDFRAVDT